MKIQIVPYDPAWPGKFQVQQVKILAGTQGMNLQIEHIGSTSVPGLGAKPVIDILLGLPDFAMADALVSCMQELGYAYIDRFEDVMPYRRLFVQGAGESRRVNIHSVEIGSEFWQRHLMFRDYLRSHDETRDAYHQLKRELAKQDWEEVSEYAAAKTRFIREIERKAREAQSSS